MTQTSGTPAELMTEGFEQLEVEGRAYLIKQMVNGTRGRALKVFLIQTDGTLSPVTDSTQFLAVKKALEKGTAPGKPLQDSMHPTR